MVQFNFDATAVNPSAGGQDVFETGEYTFQLVKSETQATKKKDGTMLVFTAACLDEGFAGKRTAIRLNLQNPSPQAVEIALADLSAISYVTGVLRWADTQELHGRPFRMRLEKVARSDDPTKFNNNILGYLDMNGNPPAPGTAGAPAAAAPPAPPAPPTPVAAPPAPAFAPAPVAAAPAAPAPAAPAFAPAFPGAAPAAPAFGAPVAGGAPTPPWAQPAG